jgi:transposase-like protein
VLSSRESSLSASAARRRHAPSARNGCGRRDNRPTSSEQQRIKALEREVKELRKANEILRLASAYFAQAELDRRLKS